MPLTKRKVKRLYRKFDKIINDITVISAQCRAAELVHPQEHLNEAITQVEKAHREAFNQHSIQLMNKHASS